MNLFLNYNWIPTFLHRELNCEKLLRFPSLLPAAASLVFQELLMSGPPSTSVVLLLDEKHLDVFPRC